MAVARQRAARARPASGPPRAVVLAVAVILWGCGALPARAGDDGGDGGSSGGAGASKAKFEEATIPTGPPCQSQSDCSAGRWCHTGQCLCPIMFTGDSCDQPIQTFHKDRKGLSRWCLIPFEEWKVHGYKPPKGPDGKPRNFTSCSVVANSKTVMKKRKGGVIDATSAVFRMNEAPSGKQYAAGVGNTKVNTIRFQNKDRGGFAEAKGEMCVVWKDNTYSPKRSHRKCSVWRITDKLEAITRNYFKVHYDPRYRGRAMLSNGMLAVYFAMHMCASVDLHGFAQGSDHYYKKFIGKPKGWGGVRITPTRRPFKERHAWKQEGMCMRHLTNTLPQMTMY